MLINVFHVFTYGGPVLGSGVLPGPPTLGGGEHPAVGGCDEISVQQGSTGLCGAAGEKPRSEVRGRLPEYPKVECGGENL